MLELGVIDQQIHNLFVSCPLVSKHPGLENSMLHLKKEPTLKDYQEYVQKLELERGFSDQSVLDKCLLLGEEVGELFKAVRKSEGLKIDETSAFKNTSHELADILIYLCSVANRYHIDLEEAFREKEEINKTRKWTNNQSIKP